MRLIFLLSFSLSLLGCSESPQPFKGDTLWKIEILQNNFVSVVGITVGETSFVELSKHLHVVPEYAYFEHADGQATIEAYYGERMLGGLSGSVIATLPLSIAQQNELKRWAKKPKPGPSGAFKYKFFNEGVALIQDEAVFSFNVALKVRLDDDLMYKLFDQPSQTIQDPLDTQTKHFIYPNKGLIITRGKRNKTLLQYIQLNSFETTLLQLRSFPKDE